jgi:UDP-N-acetylmuramate dehydrogenase
MEISTEVDLTPYNTLGVNAIASYFCKVANLSELRQALDFAKEKNLPAKILGGGSNVLFAGDYPGVIIQLGLMSIEWLNDAGLVRVGAGENWHDFVQLCLNYGAHGLENLALIPGTVGAAPIQNIGAYGVECEQFIVSVQVYDQQQHSIVEFSREMCEFSYRDSVFKYEGARHYIVLAVTFQLHKNWQPNISYGALAYEVGSKPNVSHRDVFEAVCKIRRSKLPDPKEIGNAGSFFKNPLISLDKYNSLKAQYADIPGYEVDEPGLIKTSAAWLLDQAGWKGKRRGGAGVHTEHALVIVNADNASGDELLLLAQDMASSILGKFGIVLETEVQVV